MGLLVITVNIITEVVKAVFKFDSERTINLFVVVVSNIITLIVFFAYFDSCKIQIMWYSVFAFVIIGFMVAFAAMFGFDKLLKYFEDFRHDNKR